MVTRLPETITGGDAAQRLLDEIAAQYVAKGCRVVKYRNGIRVYDSKDATIPDQSYEAHGCHDGQCDTSASEAEYGRWAKEDRQRYLSVLEQRGIVT